MKFNLNFLYLKPLFMLAGLLMCASVMANNAESATDSQQIYEYSDVLSDQTVASFSEQAAMPWPVLPGESLNGIAQLFFPKNRYMQQRFVTRALLLSRRVQPNLHADTIFSQKSMVIIPNIKLLAAEAPSNQSERSKFTKMKDVAMFIISPALQADYDNLLTRNAFFKHELDRLNANLGSLQKMLTALSADIVRIIDLALVISESKTLPGSESKIISQQAADIPGYSVNPFQGRATIPSSGSSNIFGAEQTPAISWYLVSPIASILFVISLFLGLALYSRKQERNVYKTSLAGFSGLGLQDKDLFNKKDYLAARKASKKKDSGFSVTQKEFVGNILKNDFLPNKVFDSKEDGELVLEQAKIYVDLNRESEAIMLLKAQIQKMPKEALQHWLYLLDIYRATNQKEEFLKYAKQLHQSFNVMMPLWENSSTPTAIASSIEEFAHISEKVTKLWGDCEKEVNKIAQIKVYLDELLMDNRDNERTGFSMEVFKEIMLLRNMLDVHDKLAHID